MSELFNTEALQALDDKSELKEMPRVASPALWLILTSLLMICGLALFWCIFGKLNYTVNATGVVFPFAEARPISVPFEGTVHHVVATNGQKVATGAPLASVRSQLATTTLTSPESGVVLTSKPAESKFVAREPVVWILPQELQELEARRAQITALQDFWNSYYHLRQLTLYDFLRHQPIHHY